MFTYLYKDLDFSHKYEALPIDSSEYQKHYHDFYEIYYFVKGNVVYTIEDEKQHMQPGELLFIKPGMHHFFTFLDTKTSYERYVLKFQDNLMLTFLKDFFDARSPFFNTDVDIGAQFERLDKIFENNNTKDAYVSFCCVLTELIIKLKYSKNDGNRSYSDSRLTLIIFYINKHIKEPLTITELCEYFNISRSYLYKIFYTHMKMPIVKYIRSKKIIGAYQLIKNGERPTEVAEDFGFSDYSTFYRCFVSVMGFSPRES